MKLLPKTKNLDHEETQKLIQKTRGELILPNKGTPSRDKANSSIFRKSLRKFKKMNIYVEDEEYDETTTKLVLKSLLNMVLELIPLAEDNIRTSRDTRHSYVLQIYLTQARELAHEINSIQSFETRSNRIQEMVHSHYVMILQNLLDETQKQKTNLSISLNIESDLQKQSIVTEILRQLLREHGTYVKEAEQSLNAQIDEFLVRRNPGRRR